MKKFSGIYKDMTNQYGTSYGTEYFLFPETGEEEIKRTIKEKLGEGSNYNIALCLKGDFYKFIDRKEAEEIKRKEYSGDIWNQIDISEYASFEEALEAYIKY